MITKINLVIGKGTDPYFNIALEEYLMLHTEPEQCILYLWQNQRTVVIGRNQNSYKECRTEMLDRDGGCLARRLSGGGAVFHDLGNLNFTFLVQKENYDVIRQTEVIQKAVKKLGIDAVCSGRNDLTVDGRKFSGHAFYRTGNYCCHHGTILVNVNKEDMSKYLSVSAEKLQSKSVDSVRSRVVNIAELLPEAVKTETLIKLIAGKLSETFSDCYGKAAQKLPEDFVDWDQVEKGRLKFASWEWIYGRKIPFQYQLSKRFSWGEVQIQLEVDQGRIKQAAFYSDALDVELIEKLHCLLPGTIYRTADILKQISLAVLSVPVEDTITSSMAEDIKGMFLKA